VIDMKRYSLLSLAMTQEAGNLKELEIMNIGERGLASDVETRPFRRGDVDTGFNLCVNVTRCT
jgi:hypothetical protein